MISRCLCAAAPWRHLLACLLLLPTAWLEARETTLPPSVALRTEVSYVNIAVLESTSRIDQRSSNLNFTLVENLHNQADPSISIAVEPALADKLAIGSEYVIAYQTVRKIRDNESKQYVSLPGGPALLRVQGAYPAIFQRNQRLIRRLRSTPEQAQTDPDGLIEEIFAGIAETDPAIKSFFVREIVNWEALYSHLTAAHYDALYAALVSVNANAGVRTAVLELRGPLHQGIGIARLGDQTRRILQQMSVNIDPLSEEPTLILNALLFLEKHQLADWDTLSRWTRTTVPTIAERALVILKSIDAERTRALAQQRATETLLHTATRRVLARFARP